MSVVWDRLIAALVFSVSGMAVVFSGGNWYVAASQAVCAIGFWLAAVYAWVNE